MKLFLCLPSTDSKLVFKTIFYLLIKHIVMKFGESLLNGILVTVIGGVILYFVMKPIDHSVNINDARIQTESSSAIDEVEVNKIKDSGNAFVVDEERLILENRVGVFVLERGIPFPWGADTYTISRENRTHMTEEGYHEAPVFIVKEKGESVMELEPEYDDRKNEYTSGLDEILIISPLYSTIRGLSVGATIEEALEKYPDCTFWYSYISEIYWMEPDDSDMQFMLNVTDVIGQIEVDSDMTQIYKSNFKAGSKIRSIRIY